VGRQIRLDRGTTTLVMDHASAGGTGERRRSPRPGRPGGLVGHRPEERPQRDLPVVDPADRHDLPALIAFAPRISRGWWWPVVAESEDAAAGGRQEAPVEEPAHGGQLVRVVQGAPGVPHRLAAGGVVAAHAAASCSLQLVVLPRHDAIYDRVYWLAGGREVERCKCAARWRRNGRPLIFSVCGFSYVLLFDEFFSEPKLNLPALSCVQVTLASCVFGLLVTLGTKQT